MGMFLKILLRIILAPLMLVLILLIHFSAFLIRYWYIRGLSFCCGPEDFLWKPIDSSWTILRCGWDMEIRLYMWRLARRFLYSSRYWGLTGCRDRTCLAEWC